MPSPLRPFLRQATHADAAVLSALAMRSKAHWGYDAEFLAACEDELTVSADSIADPRKHWIVAHDDEQALGFYGLARIDKDCAELEALFVTPDAIGSGVGRLLVSDATLRASKDGYKRIVIQGDPNAEGFYLAMGATRCGERESGSIPGRMLPLFELSLT